MQSSQSIKEISKALNAAQRLMGAAVKGANNPFFKSSYADLSSVIEACKDALNDNGITILQPHESEINPVNGDEINFVVTTLLHESGEYISSRTKVELAKKNDPQALGSAISYARRYGLQSLMSIPAEDDDGEKAMSRNNTKTIKSESVDTNSTTKFRRKKKDSNNGAVDEL